MNDLLKNLEYDNVKLTLRQKFYNFLFARRIIKSDNWMYGGK